MATYIDADTGVMYISDITGLGVAPEIYLSIILLFMMITMLGVFLFAPFIPYALATITKKKILFAVDRTRQIKLMSADIRNGMYYFSNRPWRFVKQYPGTFWIGKGVPCEVIHTDLGFVQDPYMNAAVEELRQNYDIENYKELQSSLEVGESPNGTPIDKDDEVLIPLFFRVPLDSLITYGAVVPPADITGEVEDLVEDRKSEMATFRKLMPWIFAAILIIMVGALAFVMITQVSK